MCIDPDDGRPILVVTSEGIIGYAKHLIICTLGIIYEYAYVHDGDE